MRSGIAFLLGFWVMLVLFGIASILVGSDDFSAEGWAMKGLGALAGLAGLKIAMRMTRT